jgi:hypothetical protein
MHMPEDVELANRLSIREAGYDEYWLQDQIYKNPACLGLGELEASAKERSQSSGGRLDILLKDSEDDTMYEVEVMLGETDETHIVRTIEYWDNEKRRWPQRQHIAVLVAEHINRRFFNVIHLLSHSIPIVGIQVALLQTGGKKSLFFTKVLDTYEEVDDGVPIQQHAYSDQDIIDYLTDPGAKQEFEKILADLRAMGTEMRPYGGGKHRWLEFLHNGEEVAYLGTLHKAFKSQHYDPNADEWVKPIVMVTHAEWEKRSKPWIAKRIKPPGDGSPN